MPQGWCRTQPPREAGLSRDASGLLLARRGLPQPARSTQCGRGGSMILRCAPASLLPRKRAAAADGGKLPQDRARPICVEDGILKVVKVDRRNKFIRGGAAVGLIGGTRGRMWAEAEARSHLPLARTAAVGVLVREDGPRRRLVVHGASGVGRSSSSLGLSIGSRRGDARPIFAVSKHAWPRDAAMRIYYGVAVRAGRDIADAPFARAGGELAGPAGHAKAVAERASPASTDARAVA